MGERRGLGKQLVVHRSGFPAPGTTVVDQRRDAHVRHRLGQVTLSFLNLRFMLLAILRLAIHSGTRLMRIG